ncbi:MAG TPA: serine acetyltransferase [Thermoanaerobaculia bacterium]|nr:serine acetyltransferase [Thermoanaerobaculia bacterium]
MKRHPFSDRLQGITQEIVRSYGGFRDPAHHIDPERRLPSRTAVSRILDSLFAVLYPGFYGVQHLTRENVEYHIGALLDDIAADLYAQVVLAWQFEAPERAAEGNGAAEGERIARLAEGAVESFLGRLPRLRRRLVLDVEAAMDGDPAARSFAEIIFAYPGFEAITIQRIAHELWGLGVPLLPRIMTELAHSKTGIDIHPGAKIGDSFFIDHGTGVVIGETAVIGSNVKIYQGVTLGALSFPKDANGRLLRNVKRHPTLCDNVVAYAGATILGGDTVIGEGAVIGGNTWVIESVPPGEKVLFTRTSRAKQRLILERAYGFGEGI